MDGHCGRRDTGFGGEDLENGPDQESLPTPCPILGFRRSHWKALVPNRPELWGGACRAWLGRDGIHLGSALAPLGPQPRTVLLRSIRCLCTHCIFLSRARFSGSTTPAKPRFSSAYSWPKDGHGGRDTGQSEMGYGQEKSSHPHADGYLTTEEEGQCFQKKPNHKEPLL